MYSGFCTALVFLIGLWCVSVGAGTVEAQVQLQRFSQEAGRTGQLEVGRHFFRQKHGGEWSCASCHGETPTSNGRHAVTGKVLQPLAPAFNLQGLNDSAKVDKWFRRNCKDVLGRECSAGEKADVLAWLISLQR